MVSMGAVPLDQSDDRDAELVENTGPDAAGDRFRHQRPDDGAGGDNPQ
jgi:hypothetical protein